MSGERVDFFFDFISPYSYLGGRLRQRAALVALAVVAVTGSAHAAAAPATEPLPPADVLCAARAGSCVPPPYVTVISAFPAEIEPLLAKAAITETISTGTRTYHVGTLANVRVVLVRCGIGLVNATTTTRGLLDRFDVSAIVFSGVAGSGLNIGDVAVPLDWTDGTETFPVAAPLFAVAQTLASPPVVLERCTPVPPDPPGPMVCLGQAPRIVAGGHGESSDPYGGQPFPCMAGGGPVFGCSPLLAGPDVSRGAAPAAAQDMETAAVARVARDAGVPYIGFRGVSDGNGDPLGLPGFPAQFFAYYRLSADNAAAAATAFLDAERLRDPSIAVDVPASPTTHARVGAACDWERAAGPACAAVHAPRAVTADVSRACGLAATAAASGTAKARSAARRARRRWHRAARRLAAAHSGDVSAACRQALVETLESRAAPAR